jgi:uncharacterized protein (TIGR00369 family)
MIVAAPDPPLFELVRDGMGDAVPFARHVTVMLDEIGDATATASLAAADEVLNHVGTVHAGALFTLAETASGAAMAGAFASVLSDIRPVVGEARIEYLRPARAPLQATASLASAGAELRRALGVDRKVTFDADVSVTDASEREVARFRATWVVAHRPAGTTGP